MKGEATRPSRATVCDTSTKLANGTTMGHHLSQTDQSVQSSVPAESNGGTAKREIGTTFGGVDVRQCGNGKSTILWQS
jgi:hypothetical protein